MLLLIHMPWTVKEVVDLSFIDKWHFIITQQMFSVLVDGHLFLSRRLLLMLTIGGKKKRHLRSLWNNHRAEAFWQCYWNQNMTAVIRSHTTCVHTLIRWFPWKKWNTREAPPFTMFKHAWGMPYLVFDCCRLLTWGEAQVYVWFLNLTLRLKGRLQNGG